MKLIKKTEKIDTPILLRKHLNNCKVLPQRWHILQFLSKNSIGAEVGVLGGDWAEKIIKNVEPSKLVLIDTFCSNDYSDFNRFTKKNHEQYIKLKFEASASIMEMQKGLSWECLAKYPNEYFDWIYIDAAHDYDSVKKDLKEAYRTLKKDGLIIMNDYIMYDSFTKEDYGVVQATNEFMIENNFEMLFFALHPNMFCDVVIKKIEE